MANALFILGIAWAVIGIVTLAYELILQVAYGVVVWEKIHTPYSKLIFILAGLALLASIAASLLK